MAGTAGFDPSASPAHPVASAAELLRQARAAEPGSAADGLFMAACRMALGSGESDVLVSAALHLVDHHRFGTSPGELPAFIHQAYSVAEPPLRGRLATALARMWVYGGEGARAGRFASEALQIARATGDPDEIAMALEAGLLAHWGPGDMAERTKLCIALEDQVAFSTNLDVRLRALCWGLASALERLDGLTLQRRLRDLEVLAGQSGSDRARYYGLCRRCMQALLAGRTGDASSLSAAASELGRRVGEADARAVEHTLGAEIARQLGDRPALAAEAVLYEEYGSIEGVPSVLAQAAVLWLEAGEAVHAGELARQITAGGFASVPRDVDWLLTATQVAEVATRTGDRSTAGLMAGLLAPLAGRGVVNAAAVSFHGIVDDYLAGALELLGEAGRAAKHAQCALAGYEALGADWWAGRMERRARGASSAGRRSSRPADPVRMIRFSPGPAGIWLIGPAEAPQALGALRGFSYLRQLVRNPEKDIACEDLASSFDRTLRGIREQEIPLLDPAALAAQRRHLAELDEEINQAEEWNDLDRSTALGVERQEFIAQLASARGLLGRPRNLGSASERARISVRKAIAAAVERIEAAEPDTARLLRAGIRTGRLCRYEPDPSRPVGWLTETRPAG